MIESYCFVAKLDKLGVLAFPSLVFVSDFGGREILSLAIPQVTLNAPILQTSSLAATLPFSSSFSRQCSQLATSARSF